MTANIMMAGQVDSGIRGVAATTGTSFRSEPHSRHSYGAWSRTLARDTFVVE